MEKTFEQTIPILILTMVGGNQPAVINGLQEGLFTKHFCKNASAEEIAAYIETL